MKILIIEDEKELARSITDFLVQSDYVCESVYTFENAIEKVNLYQYDCIIVDIMLPDGNGFQVVQELKFKNIDTGIIIISAKNSFTDKIKGLDIGADDYLTKPFHLPELSARIRALVRRKNFNGDNEIRFGDIRIIPQSHQVFVHDKSIDLTKKEYDLLIFFISNKDRVLTREAIAENLLGDQAELMDSFDFIYSHVKNMRKKIVEAGGRDYVKTIYAIGYKFGE